jgi:lysyl-tRNA synthetase class 2
MIMSDYTALEKIRLQKIEALRARGVEPYPTRAERTHTSAQAIAAFEELEKDHPEGQIPELKVVLAGRIRAARPMGKLTFAHIEDEDGRLQLFFRVNEVGQ